MPGLSDFLRNLTDTNPDNPLGDAPGEELKRVRAMRRDAATKILRETPEIVATLGTGMVAQPIAGAAGLVNGIATLARGGSVDAAVKRATDDIKETEEALTYTPKSEGAQQGLGYIGDVIEPINKLASENIADPVGAKSPFLGAVLASIPAVLPGPKGVKGAVSAAEKAAKAAKAAARGVEAAGAVARPVEAAGAAAEAAGTATRTAADAAQDARVSALSDRLHAVADARRAFEADPSPANRLQVRIAEDLLQQHRERRAAERAAAQPGVQENPAMPAAVGEPTPIGAAPPTAAAAAAPNVPDTSGYPTRLALRAINAADEAGVPIPGGQNGRNDAFNRALEAARRALRDGLSVEHAETAAHAALAEGDIPALPLPGSTEALQRERVRAAALRGENTMSGWMTAAEAGHTPPPSGWMTAAEAGNTEPAPLLDRLKAARDAEDAHRQSPTPENKARLQAATAELRRDERTGAAVFSRDDHSAALDKAQAAHNANPTPATEKALQAAVDAFVRKDTGRHVPGSTAARTAARTAVLREEPDANAALQAAQAAYNDNPTPQTEAALSQAHAAAVEAGRGRGTFAGEDWIPEPPVMRPAGMDAAAWQARGIVAERLRRYEQEGASAGLIANTRQELEAIKRGEGDPERIASINAQAARNAQIRGDPRQPAARVPPTGAPQYDLLPRADPGWEHQKLIPGLTPLSPAEGATMAARRLGARTRILRRGDPAMNRESVMAFYEGGRDNPEMFQYGVDPRRTGEVGRHASLEDYADVYNRRIPEANIDIERRGGDIDYDNLDVDIEDKAMKHGHGEPMRDRYGEYKQEKKTHERGDVPVYNEEGDPKKTVIGFTADEGPKKEKYVATGGEIVRTPRSRYGGGGEPKYTEILSEGGERMRDERGNIKWESEHDPEAYEARRDQAYQDAVDNAPSEDETIRMSAAKGGEIDVSGEGSHMGVYAGANRGPYGSLLYQTLLNQLSHEGGKIQGSGLTNINALRILSNANSNFARTGINPRGLQGTAYGDLPHLPNKMTAHETFAEGPEIWRSESDEALKRAQRAGGKPERMGFDPELGFTLDGMPATQDMLKTELRSMTPNPKDSGVGIKTLMRSAVFDWVRDATPEEAAKVAKNWSKKYGPLFGIAGVSLGGGSGGFSVQDALREKAKEEQ